jgi:hypothetical protein
LGLRSLATKKVVFIVYVCGEMKGITKTVIAVAAFYLTTGANCMGQVTFQKTYGGSLDDLDYSVQQTNDGGYIMSGVTNSFGAGDYDVYLIKTDFIGDTLWTKTYGGISDEYSYSIQQTTEGGYIIAGSTNGFGAGDYDVYLIKTDTNGDTLWTKTFGGTGVDYGTSVQQCADGGYVVAGYTGSFGDFYHDVYLIRTKPTGDTVWTKIFGGFGKDEGMSVQQTADDGYLIAGNTRSFDVGANDHVYLIKTDTTGDTLWTKTYGGTIWDYGYSVHQSADGGYIIAGITNSFGSGLYDVYLIKTDATGDTLWTKTYGGAGYDYAYSVQQTTDGGYIIAGYTHSFGAGGSDVYLIRTNPTGGTLWTKTFGGTGDDGGWSVQQTADGGYIIAGRTKSFGAGNYDVYLIKTDSSGNSGCHQTNTATIVTTPATIVTSPATIVASPATIATSPFTMVGSGGIVNTQCITTGIQSSINNAQVISVSPNPSSGIFYIHAKEEITQTEVYNYTGQKVFSSVGQIAAIDLTKEAAGLYFYSVGLKDGTVARGILTVAR